MSESQKAKHRNPLSVLTPEQLAEQKARIARRNGVKAPIVHLPSH